MRYLRRAVSVWTLLSVLAASVPVLAADDAQITVVLKSGAKYRGELVEEVPNDHVTIKLATAR